MLLFSLLFSANLIPKQSIEMQIFSLTGCEDRFLNNGHFPVMLHSNVPPRGGGWVKWAQTGRMKLLLFKSEFLGRIEMLFRT